MPWVCVVTLPWFAVTLSLGRVGIICYWCMNDTAIYNLFAGRRVFSWPWPPGEAVCLHGNCICFGSLLKTVQAPPLLKVRWWLWAVRWPGRALSRAACAQVSPKPGSWGSSCLSHAKSLNHLSYKPENKHGESMPSFHLASLFLQPAWKWIFFPMVSLCLVCWAQAGAGALEQAHLCLTCIISFCS